MKKSLTLGIPVQTTPEKDSFDTHPAAVDAWIATLPISNRGEATRRLYEALHEVNRLEIPLKQRFALLERFGRPLLPILKSLREHFSVGDFPMSEKATNIARLATEIQSEVIIGYRIILNSESSSSWLFRKSNKSMWLTSVHRLFGGFAEILENYRLLNMPPPQGIWQEIHRIFTVTEKLEWGREPVPPHGGEGEMTTIIEEYCRILLLSLVNYNYLRMSEVETIRGLGGRWARRCRLKPATEVDVPFFSLQLDCDLAPAILEPGKLSEEEREQRVCFDPSRIVAELEQILAEGDGDTLTIDEGITLSRDSVELLKQFWSPVAIRRATRQFRSESLKLVIGINAVNSLSRGEEPVPPDHPMEEEESADFIMKGDEMKSAANFEMMTSRDEEADVWNQVYVTKERQKKEPHWSELKSVAKEPVVEVDARVVNFSESGYCLQVSSEDLNKIRNGDLVALQRPGEDGWMLAALRWIQQAGDRSLLLGVELFASNALPASLVVESGEENSRPIAAMVAIGRDSELALIIPYLPSIAKKQLLLDYEGYTTGLKLKNKWLFSPSFEVYHFKDMKPKGKVPTAVAALKQLQMTESAKRAVDDNGEALWIEFE